MARVILVPGLPIETFGPTGQWRQFGSLVNDLSPGEAPGCIDLYSGDWFGGRQRKSTLLGHIRAGTLGAAYSARLNRELQAQTEEGCTVVAFSAGAWTLYDLIAQLAGVARSRIGAFVIVAGPYRNLLVSSGDIAQPAEKFIKIGDGQLEKLRPWFIDFTRIGVGLRGSSLHIVSSLDDLAVPPALSLVSDRFIHRFGVGALVVGGLQHTELCDDARVREFVKSCVR